MSKILEIVDLRIDIGDDMGVVDGVSIDVGAGEIVGLVGESGSGKSLTAAAVTGLFPTRAARVVSGSVSLEGRETTGLDARAWRNVRGARVGMVFQDPASFLDPLVPVGRQVAEALRARGGSHRVGRRVAEMLDSVGLPREFAARYPHELSGGQKQRVLIAAALVLSPALLIADEPTTALDVSVQADILALLRRLRDTTGLAVLLITHDLAVVASICDRVFVMYAGQIVESAETARLFRSPGHPYTQGLLASLLDPRVRKADLFSIPGVVPPASARPRGCRFHPRCPLALDDPCATRAPSLRTHAAGADRCWRSHEPAAADAWHADA